MDAEPVKVGAVDDHEIVLRGVAGLAATFPDRLQLIADSTTVDGLLSQLADHSVDVVLFDLHLADGSEITTSIPKLLETGAKVLVFTSDVRPVPVRQAMLSGAAGIALKSDPDEKVLEAIETVAAGEFAVTSELAYVLATDPQLTPRLARREVEALELLAQGVPKKAIGRQMEPPVLASTVNTYFTRIAQRYAQLGREVGNVYGSVREAYRDGYLDSV
jgi:DNA-binding NarL/FixJ family response regulator